VVERRERATTWEVEGLFANTTARSYNTVTNYHSRDQSIETVCVQAAC
jgi:hypothetical protein